MTSGLSNPTAATLGRSIESGKTDPRDLCEDYLSAIAEHPAAEQIYARTTPDRARTEARAASERAKSGLRRSPLDGVPVNWKDLFDTAGVATEAGSRLLTGRTPRADARMVANGAQAGLVCLGKTHMSELAFSGLGLNPMTATPPNSIDATRAPGGSSSGSAVSVALGLAAASIGSDTGGSVRIPSAWNDLVGLKTTHGLLSLEGAVPLCRRFDTAGPLCRSVEDAALLLAVLSEDGEAALHPRPLSETRLLVLDISGLGPTDDIPAAQFEKDLRLLERAGAQLETRAIPYLPDAFSLGACLYTVEAYGTWKDAIEAAPENMYHQIRARFRAGAEFSGPDYIAAWERLNALRRQLYEDISGYDAVLLPTVPIMAPETERLLRDETYYTAQNLLALRNTRVANLFDLCAITLPGATPGCGLMIMGQPFEEKKLLQLAASAEVTISK